MTFLSNVYASPMICIPYILKVSVSDGVMSFYLIVNLKFQDRYSINISADIHIAIHITYSYTDI